ncbi:hypothetical protein BKA61DRAFT_628974 [Leptodontidium sp. MPI-SDFR-AT-0119]|nr:hypothetical protein BKA61DRAFT_628974 [Leptodontidium sp. MPI-SDFR-AT-0119]
MSTETIASILPEGAGYGVVFFFALLMAGITYIQVKNEEFNTASRSVKSGLIAAGISSTVAYPYGIAGPFGYLICILDAAGATVQIFMFAVLACKVKQNAPRCHNFLEIIHRRYGRATHVVFIFFALLTNILAASRFLLGGSAVVTALTGTNVYTAIFLIPLGVCVYVVLGGLRATFLYEQIFFDYTHTLIVLIIILYFMFSVSTSNALIGSPTAMFELLAEASKARPSNFGLATTLGLAAVALTSNQAYPTYPSDMTASQVSSGLSAPLAAIDLLGNHGAVARLLTLFMAVTSLSSVELIVVFLVFTFDVYKMYMNPFVTPKQLIRVSHIIIFIFGIVMAGVACIWNAIGIDLGWLFLTMGLLIGGAVFPAALTVCWKKRSRNALYRELTITTTGSSYPTLAGNLAGVLTGLILTLVIS